jgi:membrane associated rhomboid family serine protease
MFAVAVLATHTPWALPPAQALTLGAGHSLIVFGESRYETLVTASFLHLGLVVAAFDLMVVSLAAPLAERVLGPARTAAIALLAGVAGNLAAVAHGWITRQSFLVAGATGSLAGLLAAAIVVAWRDRDARSPALTALFQWLAVVFAAGVAAKMTKQDLDAFALLGGALSGAIGGGLWRTPPASLRAVVAWVAGSTAVLLACIAVVAVRDRLDPFAAMPVEERLDFTAGAVFDGRCGDAADGLRSLERLELPNAAVSALRQEVQISCGRTESQPSVGPPSQRNSP